MRRIDREIQAWSRASARAQLGLLWEEVERGGVRSISYWEGDPWASPYMISAAESRLGGAGKLRAFCLINFGQPEADEVLFSDNRDLIGRTPAAAGIGARDIRRLLEVPGIGDREEICDLMIAVGIRRDEIDVPAITAFASHEDSVVRYVALGMLSWNPSVANDYLSGRFLEDPDPILRELAERFAAGRLRRRTRA